MAHNAKGPPGCWKARQPFRSLESFAMRQTIDALSPADPFTSPFVPKQLFHRKPASRRSSRATTDGIHVRQCVASSYPANLTDVAI